MLISMYAKRHPTDNAYSEEEAAGAYSHGAHGLLKLCNTPCDDDNSSEFEFVMSRVKNHEVIPLTPVPAWQPWVSWSSKEAKPLLVGNSGADTDEGDNGSARESSKAPISKRRTILFSVSTTKYERIERTTLPNETPSTPLLTDIDRTNMNTAEEETLWNRFSKTGKDYFYMEENQRVYIRLSLTLTSNLATLKSALTLP